MTARTDFEIANAVAAISVAPDPNACSRIFERTIAAFGVDTFACGEVDLRVLERTVFYAVGWPDAWRKFYLKTGLIRRDPLLDALNRRQVPFTWSELRRDGKWPTVGTKGL